MTSFISAFHRISVFVSSARRVADVAFVASGYVLQTAVAAALQCYHIPYLTISDTCDTNGLEQNCDVNTAVVGHVRAPVGLLDVRTKNSDFGSVLLSDVRPRQHVHLLLRT